MRPSPGYTVQVIEAPRRAGDPSLLAARRLEPDAACPARQRFTMTGRHHVHGPTGKRAPRVIAADSTRNRAYALLSEFSQLGLLNDGSESL